MSAIEISIAPRVCIRRAEISNIDDTLRNLNVKFHGERKKSYPDRDPEYLAQRTEILERRRFLSEMQHRDRRILRKVNG